MKQFKTRDSATAFMRRNGVKKEHYNNFITTDVVGGKPVFMVDDEGVMQYVDLKKTFGDKSVDGNFNKETDDGNVVNGDYYNEDGSLKADTPEQPEQNDKSKTVKNKKQKKASPLDSTPLGARTRERHEERKARQEVIKKPFLTETGRRLVKPKAKDNSPPSAKAPATKGILERFPFVRVKSIRAFIVDLLLEGVDFHTIYSGMKEVFGADKCKKKERYPEYYCRELIKIGQLDKNGKPFKS